MESYAGRSNYCGDLDAKPEDVGRETEEHSHAGEVKRFLQLLELFPNQETLYLQVINFIYNLSCFLLFFFFKRH
jgi:hypothetical protein